MRHALASLLFLAVTCPGHARIEAVRVWPDTRATTTSLPLVGPVQLSVTFGRDRYAAYFALCDDGSWRCTYSDPGVCLGKIAKMLDRDRLHELQHLAR